MTSELPTPRARAALLTLALLALVRVGDARGQTARCFALSFPDSAPGHGIRSAGDTLVLSDLPLGELEPLLPEGRRAFLGMEAYRDPAPLTYHAQAWRRIGADSVVIHPVLFMAALVWRGVFTDPGVTGQVEFATDEVGAPRPVYRFEAREVGCGDGTRGRPHTRAGA